MVELEQGKISGKRQPKYERLRDYLQNQILLGKLKPGDPLPSEPHLSASMGLARNTVRDALAALERDGLIERISGKGTFVQKDARERLRGRLDLLALVVPEQSGVYPALLDSLSSAARAVQCQVIASTTNDDYLKQADIILQLMEREVTGVVMVPTSSPVTPASHVTQLQRLGIPVILCHRGIDGVKAPLIRFSGHEIGRLAGETLAAHGHRRVGFLTQMRYNLTNEITKSFRETMTSVGGELPEDMVVYGKTSEEDLFSDQGLLSALRRLLDREDRPTALLITPDILTEFVFLKLAQAGIKVPGDISIISFGERNRNSPVQQSLVSVTLDEGEVGKHAFELLQQMSFGERPLNDESVITVPLRVSAGQTIAAPPGLIKPLHL